MITTCIQAPFLTPLLELVRMTNCDQTVLLKLSSYKTSEIGHSQADLPSISPKPVSVVVPRPRTGYLSQVGHQADEKWFTKFRKQCSQSYAKAPNLDKLLNFIDRLEGFSYASKSLGDFNTYSVYALKIAFKLPIGDVTTDTKYMGTQRPVHPSDYIATLLSVTDASVYRSGKKAMDAYLRKSDVTNLGCAIQSQDYTLPEEVMQYLPKPVTVWTSALEFLAWIPEDQYHLLFKDTYHAY